MLRQMKRCSLFRVSSFTSFLRYNALLTLCDVCQHRDPLAAMNRSDLTEKLAARHSQLTLKDVDLAVHLILDHLSHTLACGERIEIRGFGSFALNHRPPRLGRNPKTGASVHVPAKYVPHFKPGKELRERVDQ